MPHSIAVVGLAGVGRKHVATLRSMDALRCVCDVDKELAAKVGEEEEVKAYFSAQEMLHEEELDGVSLCTPPKSHMPLTELAARHGVNVIAEKPMANSVENCRRMIEVCREQGVVLMIAHKKRFLPSVKRTKELLEGRIGPAKFILHRYPHPGMSQKEWFWTEDDGGGPLLENAVHAADLLRFLAGDVEKVHAEGSTAFAEQRAPVINCGVYAIRFKNGAIASVGAGMVSCPAFGFEDVFIATDKAVLELSGRFDNADTLRYAYRENPRDIIEEKYEGADPFRLELEHFIHCIKTAQQPLTSGEEGLKAVELCLAVKESARAGAPVQLA